MNARRQALSTPESRESCRVAKAAVAPSETAPSGKVKLTLNVFLSREQAERLTAGASRRDVRAIR